MNLRFTTLWATLLVLIATPCGAAGTLGDLTGDGLVDAADLARMRTVFMTADPAADLNADGVVNYADLALLRGVTPGTPQWTSPARGVNPTIAITPATGDYQVGDQIETLVSADFSGDPTVGGTFDILFDDALLEVVSVELLPLGDPDFAVEPDLLPGILAGTGIGDFDGIVGGDIVRVTFEVIAAIDADAGTSLTSVSMRDGVGAGGPFFSAVTFLQQIVDYSGADYTLPLRSQYDYVGVITACTGDCDGYVALGGPGAVNDSPSYLTGFIQISAQPGDTFSSADIGAFRLLLGNDARPGAVSDDPAVANPYVIDAGEATLTGSGSISATGVLDSGQLALTFLTPPLATSQARLDIDIAARQFALSFDDGATQVASGDGGFVGQGRPAQIAVAPPVLDLGALQINQASTAEAVLRNVGLADLSIGSVGAADPLLAPFGFDGDPDCAGQVLAPGAACLETVRFAPEAEGVFEDSFDIPSSDAGNPVVIVAVGGEGFGVPNIQIATSVVFGDVAVGTSAVLDLSIGNNGTAPLTVEQIDVVAPLAPPFSIAADGCSGQIVAPDDTCIVAVEFAPVEAGGFNDLLYVRSDDPDRRFASVLLRGSGVGPRIVVTPASVDFGEIAVGASVSADLSIGNDGSTDLVLGSIGANDPLTDPFAVAIDGCSGQTLVPGATCTVSVTFAPQTVGDFADALSVASNDPLAPIVAVNFTGTTPARPAVLTIFGAGGGLGICWNADTLRQERVVMFGADTLDCQASGPPYQPGDNLLLAVFALVDDSAGPIGGSVSGVAPRGAICINSDTDQRVVIALSDGDTAWDCMAAGLIAAPGERVLIYTAGPAN